MAKVPNSVPLQFQEFTKAIVVAAMIERSMMGLQKVAPTADECKLLNLRIECGIQDFLKNPVEKY